MAFILPSVCFFLLILSSSTGAVARATNLNYAGVTIADIQAYFDEGRLTSRQLVDYFLRRIQSLNPKLNAVIEINPDALSDADRADRKRRLGGRPQGALHGIPILLKDNIATRDRLNTTAGSFALLGSAVPRDAGVVHHLRNAGAIILGKASLSEWSHFRSSTAPNGWSARGGQGRNPYVPKADPCGSSSGSAIAAAAGMVAVTLGTETDGSILCPSAANSVVGIKPTVGLTSRAGVVPISPRQDTVGPICRTVADAVSVLEVIVGQKGAILVDNLEITNVSTILDTFQSGEDAALFAEFKLSLNAYLSDLTISSVRSLADVIAFNNKHRTQVNTVLLLSVFQIG